MLTDVTIYNLHFTALCFVVKKLSKGFDVTKIIGNQFEKGEGLK
jgi:hypothetical protein